MPGFDLIDTWKAPFERALLHAVQSGRSDAVRLMLDCGADPEAYDGLFLVLAARTNNLEAARQLLDHGADPFKENAAALAIAEHEGHADVANLIRSRITAANCRSRPKRKPPGP